MFWMLRFVVVANGCCCNCFFFAHTCKAGGVQLLLLHITSASGVWCVRDSIDLPFGADAGSFGAVASPVVVVEGYGA